MSIVNHIYNTSRLNKVKLLILFVGTFTLLSNPGYSQKERKYIRQGNTVYEKALGDSGYVDTLRMQAAEASYRDALNEDINSFEAGFNLGASLFKQQKFAESADQYKILTSAQADKTKLAQVYHNLGNSLFMDGKLDDCIEAYKSSLRISPADTATRYNLAAAQKLLEDMKNNPDKQQQDGDSEDQEKQDQDKQEEQQQQEQDKKEQQEQQEKEEKEQQQAEEDEKGEDGEEKEAMKPDQISKEDAERLLQAIQQDEKELQEKLKKEKAKAKRVRVEKEW